MCDGDIISFPLHSPTSLPFSFPSSRRQGKPPLKTGGVPTDPSGVPPQERALTVLERRPVVVDVRQADGDGGAGRVSSTEAQHVLHLHHHQVLIPGLPVHVGPGSDDDPW